MVNADELRAKLTNILKHKVNKPKVISDYTIKLNKETDIPIEVANDYLTMREDLGYASDYMLYSLARFLIYADELNKYFSQNEIKEYSKSKYNIPKLEFPLHFKMLQVEEDQWIGTTSVSELIKLRDNQLINYNENTQRTMQKVIVDDGFIYQPTVNQKAIKDMRQSFSNRTAIPTTLTLNLPEDADVYYDKDNGELVINKTEGFHFDIVDGYHRYLSLSMEYNADHTFDYNMELRIIQFMEGKAKHFIRQEDKKTKMKRIDVAAMDQSTISTKVISRLKADPTFNLAGEINPNQGVINEPIFNLCIKSLYRKKLKRNEELPLIISTTKRLKEVINYITENDASYLNSWDSRLIIAVTYVCYKDIPLDNVLDEIKAYYAILCEHLDLLKNHTNGIYSSNEFKRLDNFRLQED